MTCQVRLAPEQLSLSPSAMVIWVMSCVWESNACIFLQRLAWCSIIPWDVSHIPLPASSFTMMAPVAYIHAPAASVITPQSCFALHCPQACAHAFSFALRLIASCQALRVNLLLFSHVLWFCRFLTPIGFCFCFSFVFWLVYCFFCCCVVYFDQQRRHDKLESWVKLVSIEKSYSDIKFGWDSCVERDSRKVNVVTG